MKNLSSEYASVCVDERLLAFLPFYKELFVKQNPRLARRMNDRVAREALLRALEEAGHAKRTIGPDDDVRLEPTEEYLRSIPPSD